MTMIVDRSGREITGVNKRINGSRRRKVLVAAEVIDGDTRVFHPISSEGGAPRTFNDVLYERYRRPATAARSSTAKPKGVTVISSLARATCAAIIYGCSGGNHGRHRYDCEQGIDGDRRHRKPPALRLQNIFY